MSEPILRDPAVLELLSAVYRWEFTRRHPYYLQHWAAAQDFSTKAGSTTAERKSAASSVALLAGALTLAGDYFDPAIDGRQQAAEDPTLDITPCAAPVTVRSFFFQQAIGLPRELREALARILLDECDDAELGLGADDLAQYWQRKRAIERLDHPLLDQVIPGIVTVKPNAPRRGIQEDLSRLVKGWRQPHKEEKRRVDTATLDAYLAVWDSREGWTAGSYDAAYERRLEDVAATVQAPVATVQCRYRAAFRYITGWDYTPEIWAVLFAPLKASRWASWRRRKPHTNVKLVTASRLQPTDSDRDGVVTGACDRRSDDDNATSDMVHDIRELIAQGHSDDAICAELECPVDLVWWVRDRMEDGL